MRDCIAGYIKFYRSKKVLANFVVGCSRRVAGDSLAGLFFAKPAAVLGKFGVPTLLICSVVRVIGVSR